MGSHSRDALDSAWRILVALSIVLYEPVLSPLTVVAADPTDSLRTKSVSPGREGALPEVAALKKQADALKNLQYTVASKLVKAFPGDFNALRVMGYVHSSHGNLEEMYKCWQQCRELRPDQADIHDQLGRYCAQIDDHEGAINHWQKAMLIDPNLPGIGQRIGYALLSLGKTNEAVAALTREIAVSANSAQAHFLLGEAYWQLGDFAKAKDCYRRAVRIQPNHKHAYYGLVKACTRIGNTEEANSHAETFRRLEAAAIRTDLEMRRNYDDLRQMKEKLVVTLVDAGRVYQEHQQIRQTEQLWKMASKVDANNVNCRTLLTSLYVRQRKAEDALQQLYALVRIEPGNAGHYQQIGMMGARVGKLTLAESAFEKALQLSPDNAAGYRMLAKFYLNTNRRSLRARQLAIKAVELEPVADSYFVLGWANAKNGMVKEAHRSLQKAIQLDPENATYRKLDEVVRKSL